MFDRYQLTPRDEDEMEDFRDYDDENTEVGSKLDDYSEMEDEEDDGEEPASSSIPGTAPEHQAPAAGSAGSESAPKKKPTPKPKSKAAPKKTVAKKAVAKKAAPKKEHADKVTPAGVELKSDSKAEKEAPAGL